MKEIFSFLSSQPRFQSSLNTALVAESFLPASATDSSSRFASARSLPFIEPEIPPPTLRYMGLVEGGRRKMTGIFRNDAGLVIAAAVGEEVQGYRIVKIEADRAILALAVAPGGIPAQGSRAAATVTLSRVLAAVAGPEGGGENSRRR